MAEIWEQAFIRMQMMWGREPTRSAVLAAEQFSKRGVHDVLIPGVGYGRNALPFLERGMSVTGIEVSETAIALARAEMKLEIPIHHGSVTEMPFDGKQYDGIFCFGLIYLLDAPGRAKLLRDCSRQLAAGGQMVFTVISKEAPMYRQGTRLDEDWYETQPGMRLFFYDTSSIERELGSYGPIELLKIDEPMPNGSPRPFIHVVCTKPTS